MTIKFQIAAFAIGSAAALGLQSCLPEPNLPDNPLIEFHSFDLNATGGRELIIGFTDGDGDIGLAQWDTLAPDFCSTCEYHYNLKCEYQELQDGNWVEFNLDPEAGQIPFYYRVPPAIPTGDNPALNGTIAIAMNSWTLISPYDSIRFRITLFDRSLNESNEAFTNVVLKP
tara:strand:+ start:3092 stop:3604 length:513 start_codon:yes stop_codon:yes gene_type:complete